ncbi:MAG: type I-C CRISPR-associated protein Cas8c/Csd1 [Candidatus Competibacter sp.]
MILQALSDYYQRQKVDLPPFGYELNDRIPFTIILNEEGKFIDWEDNRIGEGKKKRARSFFVPQSQKRPGTKGWQTAFLLWDHIGYVLGHDPEDPELAKKQHQSFKERLAKDFPDSSFDVGVFSVAKFLKDSNFDLLYEHPAWSEIKNSPVNITFRLQGDLCLICQRPKVREFIARLESDNTAGKARCLITGEISSIARLHIAIKGVRGAQTVGADIVSFNFGAACSYGKKSEDRGANSPISEYAMFAYTTSLNYLLRINSRQKLLIGEDTFVFWAEKTDPAEDLFADWLQPDPDDPARGVEAIKVLYGAPTRSGIKPLDQDDTRFFVLGLAPNVARLSIRLWNVSTVRELATHIRQHFDDLAIVRSPRDPEFLPVRRLLKSTAAQNESKNIPPLLTGETLRAILTGMPYPQSLLIAALQRIRAEQGAVNFVRAALIKAILVRNARFYAPNQPEVAVSLDLQNPNIGYRLGRLFAVLERAQETASPGLNATIRDKFYGSASATPVTAFPYLLKLKNHHLNKLTAGQVIWLENLIGQILEAITQFPANLNLDDQGRFAIGYYHQRQDFFTKKPSDNLSTDPGSAQP